VLQTIVRSDRAFSIRSGKLEFPAVLMLHITDSILVPVSDTPKAVATSSHGVRQASQRLEDAAGDVEVLCHRVEEVLHVNPQGARRLGGHR
jgi:hypothetical protein